MSQDARKRHRSRSASRDRRGRGEGGDNGQRGRREDDGNDWRSRGEGGDNGRRERREGGDNDRRGRWEGGDNGQRGRWEGGDNDRRGRGDDVDNDRRGRWEDGDNGRRDRGEGGDNGRRGRWDDGNDWRGRWEGGDNGRRGRREDDGNDWRGRGADDDNGRRGRGEGGDNGRRSRGDDGNDWRGRWEGGDNGRRGREDRVDNDWRGRGEGGGNVRRGRGEGDDEEKARQAVLMVCDRLIKDGRLGQVDISSLLNSLDSRVYNNNPDDLKAFLLKFPEVFELTKIQDITTNYNENWYVRLKPSVTLCPRHTTAGGSCAGFCGQIHICRFFMKGDGICKFGSECAHGHDFNTSHNFSILSDNLLDKLTPAHLRVALKMNQDHDEATAESSSSRPKLTTCKFYNSGSSGCTQQRSCPFLHVCVHYITGRCKFDYKCKRSHVIDEIHKFKKHGIDADHMSHVQLLQVVRDNLGDVATVTSNSRPQSVSGLHQPPTYSGMSRAVSSSSGLFPRSTKSRKDIIGSDTVPHFSGGARPKQPQYATNAVNSMPIALPTDKPEDEDHSGDRRMSSVGLSESRATVDVSLPHYWKQGLTYEKEFEKVPVDDESVEYKEIEDLVMRNLVSSNVTDTKVIGIQRIQNPERYDLFNRKRSWMLKKTQCPQSSLERRLFHGTKQHCMDAICQQGFDFRLSGMSTGTMFGKGSYFSTRAKYSLDYTDCNMIFVCKVLVGDYTLGKPQFSRPPPKDPNKDPNNLYDSCVDNVQAPDMFIVFNLDQAYPEYVVSLTDKVQIKY